MKNIFKYILVVAIVAVVLIAGVSYVLITEESHFDLPTQNSINTITGKNLTASKLITKGAQKNTTKTETMYYNNTSANVRIVIMEVEFNSSKIASDKYTHFFMEIPSGAKFIFKNSTYDGFRYTGVNITYNGASSTAALGVKGKMLFVISGSGMSNPTLQKAAKSIISSMTSI